jgi:hypothetical protein
MTNFSVYDDVKTGTLVFAGTCPVTHKPWKVFGVKHADYAAWVGGKKIQDVMPYQGDNGHLWSLSLAEWPKHLIPEVR